MSVLLSGLMVVTGTADVGVKDRDSVSSRLVCSLLRAGLSEFIEGNTTSRYIAAQMAEALGQAGRLGEGLAVIEEAIERSQSDEELWATAELLRIKGEFVRMQGIPEASAATEDQFRQALELSRQQGALSWELRAATRVAQMLRD
jgi:hypothetical protein